MLKKIKSKHYVAVIVAFIIFFLILSLLLKYTVYQAIEKEQDAMANKLLYLFHDMYSDGNNALSNLTQLKAKTCTPELLLEMRKNVFSSDYIKNIGFIQDGIITCTTGLGFSHIKDGLANTSPTFITDNNIKVWIRYPLQLKVLDNQVDAWTIARTGNFSLIIKPQNPKLTSEFIYPWEMTKSALNGSQVQHIDGVDGLWQKFKTATVTDKIINHHFEICSSEYKGYCVFIAAPLAQALSLYAKQYLVLFLVSFLLGFLSYKGILRLEAKIFSIPNRIARGLKNNKFYWLYQPIVDLKTNQIIGCEALGRFDDKYGSVSPYHFIPIIRNMNLSWQFTEMMIDRIMDDFDTAPELPDGLKISINIFPYDIQQGNTHALIKNKRLTESRFNIALEVTEDEYLEYESAQNVLSDLDAAGFSISIDDLGTGYSNLKLLNELNAKYVKIDRSFVKGIEHDGIKSSIIPHIVEIANKFGMEVIAEGIELKEQADILRKMGIGYCQGWYFGKPMTLAEVTKLISKPN